MIKFIAWRQEQEQKRTAEKPSASCVSDHGESFNTPNYLKEHIARRRKIYLDAFFQENLRGIKK